MLRVWASRLLVHAKGVITGPYRWQRMRSIARAIVALSPTIRARTRRGNDRPADAELFAYAAGLSPNFDAETYRSR